MDYGLISGIFGIAEGRVRNFVGAVKLLLCNRMGNEVSVHQILFISSEVEFGLLGIKKSILERSLYRDFQKVAGNFQFFLRGIRTSLRNMNGR